MCANRYYRLHGAIILKIMYDMDVVDSSDVLGPNDFDLNGSAIGDSNIDIDFAEHLDDNAHEDDNEDDDNENDTTIAQNHPESYSFSYREPNPWD